MRNVLKIGIPWLIGHAAVFAIVATSANAAVPTAVWIVTGLAYVIPIVYILSLFVGTGHTPYDRFAGTTVVKPAAG